MSYDIVRFFELCIIKITLLKKKNVMDFRTFRLENMGETNINDHMVNDSSC